MFIQTINHARTGRKSATQRHLLSLLIAFVFGLAIYPSRANAQITGELLVNVPFTFNVGNAKLPAGEYRINVMDDSNLSVMTISNTDGSASAFFQVRETQAGSTPDQSELIFNRYGNTYFLSTLYEEGSALGSQVLESRQEKIISQQTTQAQEHVPAHRGAQRGN
jgi:hypothetical protein